MLIFLSLITAEMFVQIKIPDTAEYLGSIKEGTSVTAVFGTIDKADTYVLSEIKGSKGRAFRPTSNDTTALTAVKYESKEAVAKADNFNTLNDDGASEYKLVYELYKAEEIKENQIINIEPLADQRYHRIYFGHLCAAVEDDRTVHFKRCSDQVDASQTFEIITKETPDAPVETENVIPNK